ncbi:MAG TPA: alkaline phosphatase family protein [Gammaproteobacteria bacterium]|nr:alkaline phosphatase family protein [Gammaproteobacteria bacterium]
MEIPDYNATSLVNLMTSLVRGLGNAPSNEGYPELPALPAASVAEAVGEGGTVLLVVVDGLGYEFLASRPGSFLARHCKTRLTSVFPTTTATAVTTYLTGLAPQQHALTGWFTYLKELGEVAAVLPFRSRGTGADYAKAGVDPRTVFDWPALFDRLPGSSNIVTADYIRDSAFSRVTGGTAARCGYKDLPDFVEVCTDCVLGRSPGSANADRPRYVYAYWPTLDALAHAHGVTSAEVAAQFEAVDAALAELAGRLAGSGTLLIISADHGLIDTSAPRTIHVENHARLAQALTLPLCGEPRTAYCYVRPSRERDFRDYIEGELAEACVLKPAEALIEEGFFGRGTPHPRLRDRIGDYALLMKENWIVKDRVATEKPFAQIGVHGGLSAEELYVPLIVPPV